MLLDAFFEVFPEGLDEGGGMLGMLRGWGREGQLPGAEEVQVEGGEVGGEAAGCLCRC